MARILPLRAGNGESETLAAGSGIGCVWQIA